MVSINPTTQIGISELNMGEVSETSDETIIIGGVLAIARKLTPILDATDYYVSYDPNPGVATNVTIRGITDQVSKIIIATSAPQNGYNTLRIVAFDAIGNSLSDFAVAPLSITLSIPGYNAASLTIHTYATIGGSIIDTLSATRNQDDSYTLTLSQLTYIRVSQNVPCFVAGTNILTATGYKAVEEIIAGELIATADGRALPCKIYMTEVKITTKDNAPYLIPANTFAPRCPARDLIISPLHAIQLSRGVWQIPKMAATLYSGVHQITIGSSCTYYHLEMPNYLTDNIVAEGTVVESYGARQLVGRRVEYKFNGAAGGFLRTITEARRSAVKRA